MKLPEVLDVLLKAEEQVMETRLEAERNAKALVEEAHSLFARDQEARLATAREEARAQVESARQAVEMEALQIAEMARKTREKMQEHFDKKVPQLISKLCSDLADRYATQGRLE